MPRSSCSASASARLSTLCWRRAPDVGVVAWERDPWLLRLALGQNDWSAALASGRLRLLLGSDLIEHAAAMRARGTRGAAPRSTPFWARSTGTSARGWIRRRCDRPLVLLCAGGLFVDDLAAALGRAGFAPYTLDIHRLSREELDRTMGRLRPAPDRGHQLHRRPGGVRGGEPLQADLLGDRSHHQRAAALPSRRVPPSRRSCSPIAAPRSTSCAPAASPTSSTCRWPPIWNGARRCR